jgi:hypothetical protein
MLKRRSRNLTHGSLRSGMKDGSVVEEEGEGRVERFRCVEGGEGICNVINTTVIQILEPSHIRIELY